MKEKELEGLIDACAERMEALRCSEKWIRLARRAWSDLDRYMGEHGCERFNAVVCDRYCNDVLQGREYSSVAWPERSKAYFANLLVEVLETGTYKPRRESKYDTIPGQMAPVVLDFLEDRRRRNAASGTVKEYRTRLRSFCLFMKDVGASSVADIDVGLIVRFAERQPFEKPHSRSRNLAVLRIFLKWLHEEGLTEEDLSSRVPKARRPRQPKLPSAYSPEEVEKMLCAIDRSSAKGKRDLCMVLLACRLGLRASDICSMRFGALDWDASVIRLMQMKTGSPVELPLLPEIGEAVIDYLRCGRPESDSPYVFLTMRFPHERLDISTLGSIVGHYMRKAGIESEGARKHGTHSLRHSLAASLLEAGTPLPVISDVLGHESTDSTRYYLRIGESALRQCALDVCGVGE